MKYPPDQFLAALRATKCPEAVLGAAARINTYGEDDVRYELISLAWERALSVCGRDVEVLLPDHQGMILSTMPPVLDDPNLTRITVPDEMLYERAGLGTGEGLTGAQRRAVSGYARCTERAYQELLKREAPALLAWQRANDYLEGK